MFSFEFFLRQSSLSWFLSSKDQFPENYWKLQWFLQQIERTYMNSWEDEGTSNENMVVGFLFSHSSNRKFVARMRVPTSSSKHFFCPFFGKIDEQTTKKYLDNLRNSSVGYHQGISHHHPGRIVRIQSSQNRFGIAYPSFRIGRTKGTTKKKTSTIAPLK